MAIKEDGLTFDDISLIPQFSDIDSRHDVDISCGEELGVSMTTPIISANMETVTGFQMALAMKKAGGIGALHRFQDLCEFQRKDKLSEIEKSECIVSIGVDLYEDRLKLYNELGFNLLCIDVAHGHHSKVEKTIKFVRDKYGSFFKMIAGNVCTPEGTEFLHKCGADAVKVGVGPGSHCTTRIVTGHGVPQLTAIASASKVAPCIIADGGIRHSGDIAKAMAFGAKYVMIGKLFAGCTEAPSELILVDGVLKKVYRGSASYEAQISRRDKKTIISEGVQSLVPYIGDVHNVVCKLSNGLKSALSYSGARNLKEFRSKARFLKVTSASYLEGTPHGVV